MGFTGPTGPTGSTGDTGPSRLIASAHIRGTDGAQLSSFGFVPGLVRTGVGTYLLTLTAPAPGGNIPVGSLNSVGFYVNGVIGLAQIAVNTLNSAEVLTDKDFFIVVTG